MNDEKWIISQIERLKANSVAYGENGCLLCSLGGGRLPYSTLTVTFPGIRGKKTLYSHRFMLMLYLKVENLPKHVQVSHICHNNRCVNIDHLSLEPEHVNKDRQICRGLIPKRCKHHSPHKDCIL